jgi:hypothetical protein
MKIVHVIDNKMQTNVVSKINGNYKDGDFFGELSIGVEVTSETSIDGDHEEINISGNIKDVINYFESTAKELKKLANALIEDNWLDKDFRK